MLIWLLARQASVSFRPAAGSCVYVMRSCGIQTAMIIVLPLPPRTYIHPDQWPRLRMGKIEEKGVFELRRKEMQETMLKHLPLAMLGSYFLRRVIISVSSRPIDDRSVWQVC